MINPFKNEIGGTIFDVPHQVRKSHRRFQTDEPVYMIGNPIDDDRFLSLVLHNSAHVFEHFPPPLFLEEVLPFLDGEEDLNVNLGIYACHARSPMIERTIPVDQDRG